MTTDVEFYIDARYREPISIMLSEKGFSEKKPELVADINPDILSFAFSGGASVLFGVLANILYGKTSKSTSLTIEVTIINEHGEKRISVDGKQKMQLLELESEGSFISIRMK